MTNKQAIEQINNKINYLEGVKTYGNFSEIIEALEMAVQALQKQIPIKPKNYDDIWQHYIECPTCNKRFPSWFRYKDCTQRCPYCSQAISSLYDEGEVTE